MSVFFLPYFPVAFRVFGEGGGVNSARGATAILAAGRATTLETCLDRPFRRTIANKRLHSKQRKQLFDHCQLLRPMNRRTNYCDRNNCCDDTPCRIYAPLRTPKLRQKKIYEKMFGLQSRPGWPEPPDTKLHIGSQGKGVLSSESWCHLHVVIFRRVPGVYPL